MEIIRQSSKQRAWFFLLRPSSLLVSVDFPSVSLLVLRIERRHVHGSNVRNIIMEEQSHEILARYGVL